MGRLTLDEYDRLLTDLTGLVKSNLPLPQGLRDLGRTMKPARLRGVSVQLADDLEKGIPLSKALENAPHRFPAEFIALVRCGELSGDPYSLLDFSVEHARRVKRHRTAVITSVYYPMIVFVATILVFLLLAYTVAPNAERAMHQVGLVQPWLTGITLTVASVLRTWPGTVGCLAVVAGILALFFVPMLRDFLLRQLGMLPGFNKLVELSDCAVLMKFLAVMLPRGVPLPDALRAARLGVVTRKSRKTLSEMSIAAEQGWPVAAYLSGAVPATAAYMFRTSELRGNVAEACAGIANYCEERFEIISQRTSTLLEPIMLLLIGTFIAILIVSLYLPLFAIPKVIV